MERTNRNVFVFALVIIVAIIAIAIFLLGNNNEAPVSNFTLPVTLNVVTEEKAPALTPVSGSLTYNCPVDGNCARTGSSEWFDVTEDGNVFTINTFGGTQITAASDIHGQPITFTSVHNSDGSTTINFNSVVSGRVLLTLNRGNAQSDITYGVR
jgi:hypothetical protein